MVNEETSDTIDDLKLDAILVNISKDENSCFQCFESHIDFDQLRTLIQQQQQQQIRRKSDEASINGIRMLVSILSITNTTQVIQAWS